MSPWWGSQVKRTTWGRGGCKELGQGAGVGVLTGHGNNLGKGDISLKLSQGAGGLIVHKNDLGKEDISQEAWRHA